MKAKWPTKRLGELCDVEGGNAAPQGDEHYESGTIPFVRMKDLGRYHFTTNLCATDDRLTEASAAANRMKVFEPGCILFPRSGSVALNHRAILGVRARIVSHIGVLQNFRAEITAGYLYLFLTTFDMTALSKKTTGVDSINFADVKRIPVLVPPLAEQRRIVAILDEAENLRTLRRQADRRTADLIPALFHDMFGDPRKSSGHEMRSLVEVCTKITDGVHITPTYVDDGVPFLRVTDIQQPEIDWARVKRIPQREFEEITRRVKAERGDVLYSKNGTIGIPREVTWNQEFAHFVSLALLKPNRDLLLPGFLAAFLSTPFALDQAHGHSKKGTVTNLHLVEIRKIRIPVPPLPMQHIFMQRATEIRTMQEKQAASRRRLDDLFHSLLHRAFRGEI